MQRWECCRGNDAWSAELLQQSPGNPPSEGGGAVHQGNPDDGWLWHGVLHGKGTQSNKETQCRERPLFMTDISMDT